MGQLLTARVSSTLELSLCHLSSPKRNYYILPSVCSNVVCALIFEISREYFASFSLIKIQRSRGVQ